jgi:hypothetical protein
MPKILNLKAQNLSPYNRYYFRIKTLLQDGTKSTGLITGPFQPLSKTQELELIPPENLQVLVGNQTLIALWDNRNKIKGLITEVNFRDATSPAWLMNELTETDISWIGSLVNGTAYYIRVRILTPDGKKTGWLTSATSYTPAVQPDTTPPVMIPAGINIAQIGTSDDVFVNWQPSTTRPPDITAYLVYLQQDGIGSYNYIETVRYPETFITIKNLEYLPTKYRIGIEAIDSVGNRSTMRTSTLFSLDNP